MVSSAPLLLSVNLVLTLGFWDMFQEEWEVSHKVTFILFYIGAITGLCIFTAFPRVKLTTTTNLYLLLLNLLGPHACHCLRYRSTILTIGTQIEDDFTAA